MGLTILNYEKRTDLDYHLFFIDFQNHLEQMIKTKENKEKLLDKYISSNKKSFDYTEFEILTNLLEYNEIEVV